MARKKTPSDVTPMPTLPFLPDSRKWLWRNEAVALKELGFEDTYTPPVKDGAAAPTAGEQEEAITLQSPNDPRRQALRLVLGRLLEDTETTYALTAATDKLTRRKLDAKEGGFKASEIMGEYLFQADRTTDKRYSAGSPSGSEGERNASAHPTMPVVRTYFMDPRVITQKVVTAEMVKEALVHVESGTASNLREREYVKAGRRVG